MKNDLRLELLDLLQEIIERCEEQQFSCDYRPYLTLVIEYIKNSKDLTANFHSLIKELSLSVNTKKLTAEEANKKVLDNLEEIKKSYNLIFETTTNFIKATGDEPENEELDEIFSLLSEVINMDEKSYISVGNNCNYNKLEKDIKLRIKVLEIVKEKMIELDKSYINEEEYLNVKNIKEKLEEYEYISAEEKDMTISTLMKFINNSNLQATDMTLKVFYENNRKAYVRSVRKNK